MEFTKSVEDLKDKSGEVYATNVEVFTLAFVPFEPSEALKAAISAGSVKTSKRTVSYDVKEKDVIVKQYRQEYTKCVANSKSGALALPGVNGDESKIWDFVSQRADSVDYQPIYVTLRNQGQGPEAAVKKFSKLTAGLSPEQLAAVKELLSKL